jgi:ABC-2 type transport system permease protein
LFSEGLTKRGTERAGFLFTWDMMARSKDFKMKVLPQFGYILVFFVIFYLQKQSSDSFLILLTYISSSVLAGAILQVPYSEKYKASWLFHVTPIKAPGLLIGGSVKAMLAMFYQPIAVFLLVLGLVVLGPSGGLVSIVTGLLNLLAIALLQAYLNYRQLPFSTQIDGTSNGGGYIRTMMTLVPIGALGLLHYLIRDMTWALAILSLLSAVASGLLYKAITSLEWADMKG